MAGKWLVVGISFSVAAFVLMVIAFASPYWVESFWQFQGRFTKIGLWEVCFNDYTFYKDYNAKRYLGCWYIFSDEVRPIWEWLSPPWFISLQVMVSLSLLVEGLNTLALGFFLFKFFPKYLDEIVLWSTAGVNLFLWILIFIILVVFGMKKEDRNWVPRPDMNFLSWSYWLCFLSGLCTLISALGLWKASKQVDKEANYGYPPPRNY